MKENTFTSIELDNFKNKIKEKWSYEEDLSENIAIAASDVINYFGIKYKNMILSAIESCKFITLKSSKRELPNCKKDALDFVSKNYPTFYSVAEDKIYRNISEKGSLYLSVPRINPNSSKISDVERVILLPHKFNYDIDFYRGLLIREIVNLIMSFNNNYFVINDILLERNGISVTKYHRGLQNEQDNKVIDIKGIGLESGLSIYMELCIMRKINDIPNYDIDSMQNLRLTSSFIFENLEDRKKTLLEIVLNGDVEKIINLLSTNSELISITDELMKLEEQILETIGNKKNNILLSQINPILKRISPFIKKFNASIKDYQKNNKKSKI